METFDCERNPFAPDAQKRTNGKKTCKNRKYSLCKNLCKLFITFAQSQKNYHYCQLRVFAESQQNPFLQENFPAKELQKNNGPFLFL